MQLKQLTMHNFGPYRDEQVDFTAFATARLFLISGKTGSGKTTIFDALVYALYGTTTGGERSGNEMRANFATPKEPTAVSLTFSHGGRDYLVHRAPEQLLAKKRGKGLTKVAAKVSLKIFVAGREEAELTKVQQVRERIQNLLQLDADQFRQMVLLPQGKFRQFLDANSDAKEALLRHLFGTELYARWQAALQAAAKKQSAALAKQRAQLDALMAQFDYGALAPAPHAPLAERLALMRQVVATQEQAVAQAQQQATVAKQAFAAANAAYHHGDMLQAAYSRREHAEAELAELAKAEPQRQAAAKRLTDLQWAHELAPVAARITQRQQQQTQLSATKKQLAAALTQAQAELQAATDQAAALHQQAATVAAAKERLQTLSKLQAQLEAVAQAAHEAEAAQAATVQAAQAQQQTAAAVQAGEAAIAANQQAATALQAESVAATLQAEETLAAKLAGLAQQRNQTQRRLATAERQQAALVARLQTLQAALQVAQKTYTDLHDRRLNNQIAALIAQLSPGAPCPVCGSREHPQPATVAETAAVSQAALEAADRDRTQAQAAVAAAQAQLAQAQAQATQLHQDQASIEAQIQKAAGKAREVTAEATLSAQSQRLATLRQQAAAQQQRQQALTAQAQTLAAEHQQLRAQQTASDAKHQAAQVAEARAQANLASAQALLPKDAPKAAALAAEQARLQAQVTIFEQAQTANQERLQTARDKQTRLQTHLVDQTAQLESLTTELRADQAQLTAARTAHQVDEATFKAWLAAGTTIPELQQRLAAARENIARQQALVAAADQQIAGSPRPDLAALAATRQQADAAASAAQQTLAQRDQQHQQAARILTQAQADYQRNQAALTTGVAMQDLAAVVSGNNAQKLSLERYVLRAYLQQVLVVANKRLEGLSDGRYQLVLHQDPGSYRNDSGLEIDVYDDQVGETRSVHTLSGGESFIAALALALALGEVIQQAAGGITIDALFIDEGFGSLDSTSLDTALAALESIEGQSRLIGIISHVESLQSGIADQLRVQPTGAGDSHIRVLHLGE